MSLFKTEEIAVIDRVIEALKNKTSTEISSLSHEQDGWQQSELRQLISYNHAIKLPLASADAD